MSEITKKIIVWTLAVGFMALGLAGGGGGALGFVFMVCCTAWAVTEG